jgi:hypothetical protein
MADFGAFKTCDFYQQLPTQRIVERTENREPSTALSTMAPKRTSGGDPRQKVHRSCLQQHRLFLLRLPLTSGLFSVRLNRQYHQREDSRADEERPVLPAHMDMRQFVNRGDDDDPSGQK